MGEVIGGIFGGVAANEAADSQADGQRYAADQAAKTARLGFDFARQNPYIQPYVQTGTNAQNMMAALLGVPTGAPAGTPEFGALGDGSGGEDYSAYLQAVPEAQAFVDRVLNDPQGKIWSPDKGWRTESKVRMRGYGDHQDPNAIVKYWYNNIGRQSGAPSPMGWDPDAEGAWRTGPVQAAQPGQTPGQTPGGNFQIPGGPKPMQPQPQAGTNPVILPQMGRPNLGPGGIMN